MAVGSAVKTSGMIGLAARIGPGTEISVKLAMSKNGFIKSRFTELAQVAAHSDEMGRRGRGRRRGSLQLTSPAKNDRGRRGRVRRNRACHRPSSERAAPGCVGFCP